MSWNNIIELCAKPHIPQAGFSVREEFHPVRGQTQAE